MSAGAGDGDRRKVSSRLRRRLCASVVAAVVVTGCSASGPGSTGQPAASYQQGGVSGGGFVAQAGGPHTPRASAVGFFTPVSDYTSTTDALDNVEQILKDENYPAPTWSEDPTYGTDDPGGATLTSFKMLAQDGIVIVATHGGDTNFGVEYYCSLQAAISAIVDKYDADFEAGYIEMSVAPGKPSVCPSLLPPDWQSTVNALIGKVLPGARIDVPGWLTNGGPALYDISVTRKGLEHYFGQDSKTSLLFLMSCDASPVVADFTQIETIFSYPGPVVGNPPSNGPTPAFLGTCGGGPGDVEQLFKTMAGDFGPKYRSTADAYNHWQDQWSASLQYQEHGGPVLLSPAVENVDPSASAMVPGTTTTVTVKFDTEMAGGNAQFAELKGCGATLDGDPSWNGDNTQLQFKVKVPLHPPDATLSIRLKNDAAVAGAPGWQNPLSGNDNGDGANGKRPNQNDYVWKVPCGQNLDLSIDGTDGGKPIKGLILGDPATDLTCYANSPGTPHAGNIVHWSGEAAGTNTPISGEFDVEYGTWPLGDAQGDQSITIDEIVPKFDHISSVSGTITQNPGGGSIDAVVSGDGDTMHISGTWTCASGGSQP